MSTATVKANGNHSHDSCGKQASPKAGITSVSAVAIKQSSQQSTKNLFSHLDDLAAYIQNLTSCNAAVQICNSACVADPLMFDELFFESCLQHITMGFSDGLCCCPAPLHRPQIFHGPREAVHVVSPGFIKTLGCHRDFASHQTLVC